ncbi:hypothetical protein HDF18_03245 [Mucilaginibacter sp. X5P1]|uniref:hypothetical protein n=1 Tax=Mucilaginibacter sp. X5P1 TaxID=2723088 RepID=UPI00161A7B71|nr:hypothetical protein [Mucilaginibacter sp. X5P1]MBB6136626.1 hypothetical protein [Mucilaginibacter sp. X5P1]
MKKSNLFKTMIFLLLSAGIIQGCKKDNQKIPSTGAISATASSDALVLTPYGRVPASQVFADDPGTTVSVENGRVVEKNDASGKVLKDFGAYDAQTSNTPPGRNLALKLNSLAVTSGTGYYTSASVPAGDTIKKFTTRWIVPVAPTNDSTQFLWNGLDGGSLQPVLQWGNGSTTWQIANWYYLNGYHHGTYITIPAGTALTGVITLTAHTDTSYTYTESFTGYAAANVTVVRPTLANSTAECWESYTNSYIYFPNQSYVGMTNINCLTLEGTHPSLPWVVSTGSITTPSGKNTVVVSDSGTNGEVDFYFR